MRTFTIALAMASFVSTGTALADDVEFDCPGNACSMNISIEKQTTDKFTTTCSGKGTGKASCKPSAGHVSCEAGARDNQCSCTNTTEIRGSADVSVGC